MNVLIVDDSSWDRQSMLRIVAAAGHHAEMASDGEQALVVAKSQLPDCILLDISMPELDGIAVARQLARDPATRSIPIVFVTGRSGTRDRLWGTLMGCAAYLPKPVNAASLLPVLARIGGGDEADPGRARAR